MVALSEIVDIRGGGTPSKKVEEYWGGEIPWASVKDFKSEELSSTQDYITELGVNNSATNIIPAGNIIVPTRMALGKVAINSVDMAINQDLKALIVKDEGVLDKNYLMRFLQSKSSYIKGEGKGATVKGITLDVLNELEVPLPFENNAEKSLKEQVRLAAILEKADSIRRKRQQSIKLADEFLRSVFLDVFGDPVTNPKGWDAYSWDKSLRIVNGKNQKNVESEAGKYPICGSGGEMSRADDWLTKENSVIIGRKGNINKPILMKEKFWNVDTAFGLEPNANFLSHNYLYWYCRFFDFERLNKAVTIPSLTKADLLEIVMPVPSYKEQLKFDIMVEKTESLLEKSYMFTDMPLFESLSQKAFSGEL
ncbi:restriction endonuclease subunit S [Pseudomonadales bacterium]|nr:restriction endonuclease subunit S [Pseudomonadales bacterium]